MKFHKITIHGMRGQGQLTSARHLLSQYDVQFETETLKADIRLPAYLGSSERFSDRKAFLITDIIDDELYQTIDSAIDRLVSEGRIKPRIVIYACIFKAEITEKKPLQIHE